MRSNSPLPFRPLPGTEPPARGLFIDRWGTLLELPARSEPKTFADASFVPGAVDALYRAQCEGWKLYLIGNEDSVALGRMSDEAWGSFESELLRALQAHGVRIVRNYACLDHPEGQGAHQKPSVFRLPDTGIFYHALQADGLVLQQSWVVGDSTIELAAASRAGLKSAAVRTGRALGDAELLVEPDLDLADLSRVLDLLVRSPAYARQR